MSEQPDSAPHDTAPGSASHDAAPGVPDEALPEDLQPGEDNPLAEGLEPGERAGDLLEEGKHAEQSADPDDEDPASDSSQS